jgi:hypothetical protein
MLNRGIILYEFIMEYDRFEKHHALYLIGISSLILGLMLIAFGVFCIPHVIFKFNYTIPLFFYEVSQRVQTFYGMTENDAELMIVGGFVFVGFVLLLIAEIISNHIEKTQFSKEKIFFNKQEVPTEELPSWVEQKQGGRIALIVFLVLMLTVGGVKLLEWSVSSNTMTPIQ